MENIFSTFELIEIDSADTREELCNKESYYIQQYDSYYKNGKGYNMTYGGEGTFGYEFTTEDRQKMSEAQKKRFENPEARQKKSEAMKKRYEDPNERENLSEVMKKHRTKMLNTKGQNKPFDVFKKDGTFIKTFTYQFEAHEYLQKELNITSTIKIGEVLCGKRNTSAGFKFKYKE